MRSRDCLHVGGVPVQSWDPAILEGMPLQGAPSTPPDVAVNRMRMSLSVYRSMPPAMREVLLLWLDGQGESEVARALGVCARTAGRRLAGLREHLETWRPGAGPVYPLTESEVIMLGSRVGTLTERSSLKGVARPMTAEQWLDGRAGYRASRYSARRTWAAESTATEAAALAAGTCRGCGGAYRGQPGVLAWCPECRALVLLSPAQRAAKLERAEAKARRALAHAGAVAAVEMARVEAGGDLEAVAPVAELDAVPTRKAA